jgi:hypothetical protein
VTIFTGTKYLSPLILEDGGFNFFKITHFLGHVIIYCCHGNSTQQTNKQKPQKILPGLKKINVQSLKPHYRGPFVVILSIPTATGQQPYSSHSRS